MLDNKYFPFAKVRPEQQEIFDAINKDLKKRYIIIEAATGIGKSPIAIEAALSDGKGYIVTDSIQLQNQYESDFSKQLVSMKGKGNYTCTRRPSLTCDVCPLVKNRKELGKCIKTCAYHIKKQEAEASPIFLTNYAFYLTSSFHNPNFKPRNVVVFDEAHLLEKHLTESFTIEINVNTYDKKYDLFANALPSELNLLQKPISSYNGDYEKFIQAIKVCLDRELKKLIQSADSNSKLLDDPNLTEEEKDSLDFILSGNKVIAELQSLIFGLDSFLMPHNDGNWLTDITTSYNYDTNQNEETLQLKPLKVDWAFHAAEDFATDHVYFLSATILDHKLFCASLGIDENDVLFVQKESPFDPNNSPIYEVCTCKTSYAALQDNANLDKIADYVKMILDIHKNEKGIIHSGNKRISVYLKNKLNDTRLLVNDNVLNNREIYNMHLKSKDPTVLVSSSMSEGVDLKDDLSRFQIVVKMPFDSLADIRVKTLAKMNQKWYQCEMMKKFVQQCGRSTRSENDHCTTYVLDESFVGYLKSAQKNHWLTEQFVKRCRPVTSSN